MTQDLLHSFPGQAADEPVFIFVRPYPIAFIPTALIFVFVFVLSLIAQFLLRSHQLIDFENFTANVGIMLLGVFQLITLIVFFVAVFDFYFDIVIVTDRRLVDIDQEQLFFRRISELSLEDIEDVSSQVKGLFATVFDYGLIEIQTAGARENFYMHNIHFPREVTALILDLKHQAEQNVPHGSRVPHSGAIAIINNKILHSTEELKAVGAMPPSSPIPPNAPQ